MGRNGVRRLKERTERDGERNQNPDGVTKRNQNPDGGTERRYGSGAKTRMGSRNGGRERNQNPDGVEATGRVAGHKSINLTTTNINIGSKHSEKLNYLSSTSKIRG